MTSTVIGARRSVQAKTQHGHPQADREIRTRICWRKMADNYTGVHTVRSSLDVSNSAQSSPWHGRSFADARGFVPLLPDGRMFICGPVDLGVDYLEGDERSIELRFAPVMSISCREGCYTASATRLRSQDQTKILSSPRLSESKLREIVALGLSALNMIKEAPPPEQTSLKLSVASRVNTPVRSP